MRKLLFISVSSLISLVLFSTTGILPAYAAGGTIKLYVTPATATQNTGSSIAMQIRLSKSDNTFITYVDANLTFPTSKLSVSSLSTSGSTFTQDANQHPATHSYDNNAGTIDVSGQSSSPAQTGDFIVATVVFTLKASGTAAVNFTGQSYATFPSNGPNDLTGTSGASYTITNPASGSTTPTSPSTTPVATTPRTPDASTGSTAVSPPTTNTPSGTTPVANASPVAGVAKTGDTTVGSSKSTSSMPRTTNGLSSLLIGTIGGIGLLILIALALIIRKHRRDKHRLMPVGDELETGLFSESPGEESNNDEIIEKGPPVLAPQPTPAVPTAGSTTDPIVVTADQQPNQTVVPVAVQHTDSASPYVPAPAPVTVAPAQQAQMAKPGDMPDMFQIGEERLENEKKAHLIP